MNAPVIPKLNLIPQFIGHKVVRAAKILGIAGGGEDSPFTLYLDCLAGVVTVPREWIERRLDGRQAQAAVGGWFVVYKDGYTSWSPDREFRDGYSAANLQPPFYARMPDAVIDACAAATTDPDSKEPWGPDTVNAQWLHVIGRPLARSIEAQVHHRTREAFLNFVADMDDLDAPSEESPGGGRASWFSLDTLAQACGFGSMNDAMATLQREDRQEQQQEDASDGG
jgi:hypothetical protein